MRRAPRPDARAGLFFSYATSAEHVLHAARAGQSVEVAPLARDVRAKIDARLVKTVLTSWTVWPLLNFANFFLVPPHLRIVASSTVSVLWSAFLSYTQHGAPAIADQFVESAEDSDGEF